MSASRRTWTSTFLAKADRSSLDDLDCQADVVTLPSVTSHDIVRRDDRHTDRTRRTDLAQAAWMFVGRMIGNWRIPFRYGWWLTPLLSALRTLVNGF
jgi:hypothetical protein